MSTSQLPPTPTRPSAGYALTLHVDVPTSEAGSALVRAIGATGADVRDMQMLTDRSRRLVVACSGADQQDAVRAAVATTEGVSALSIEDTTFALHAGGKIEVVPRVPVGNPSELAMAYTPGVGRVSSAIAEDPTAAWSLTGRSNAVAVLSDGSAVLGLGNIGPLGAMPVMEGKAVLFKQFGGVDAYPICVDVHSADEIVAVAKALAPTFGGINLEDIAAPVCFEVEERLQTEVDIPVFHDDQHGTAIVTLAALENAARVVGRPLSEMTVVVMGAGAAGVACAKLMHSVGVGDIIGVDRGGILDESRTDLVPSKRWFVDHGNRSGRSGDVRDALKGADVLLGLSGPGVVEAEWLGDMADEAIVFAMANPVPEVMPELMPSNIAVVATGRSDYPNQINNVLAFPGVFRGLLDVRASHCSEGMKLAAARALAGMVENPTPDRIIPGVFDHGVADAVAAAVREAARAEGAAGIG
jgi:malate dehydrogenase (oxaloacetate-decarboxylating)